MHPVLVPDCTVVPQHQEAVLHHHIYTAGLPGLLSSYPQVSHLILAHVDARFLLGRFACVDRLCRHSLEDDGLWLHKCNITAKPAVPGSSWRCAYWRTLRVPEDYANIEDALATAPDRLVFCEEGNYSCHLQIVRQVEILSEVSGVVLQAARPFEPVLLIKSGGVRVRGLRVQGRDLMMDCFTEFQQRRRELMHTHEGPAAIEVSALTERDKPVVLHELTIQNPCGFGVVLKSSAHLLNCVVAHNAWSGVAVRAAGTRLESSLLSYNRINGAWVAGGTGRVTGCLVGHNGCSGLCFNHRGSGLVERSMCVQNGVNFPGGTTGVDVWSCAGSVVQHEVDVDDAAVAREHCSLLGSLCSRCKRAVALRQDLMSVVAH